MKLDVTQIQEILPHRYPFLFLDRAEELEPGKSAVCYKNVSVNEEVFLGHFPGAPVFPGVLQVETLAQAGALCILAMPENKGKLAFFGGINKAKFKRMVKPGDVMKVEIIITDIRGPIGRGEGKITVDGELACSAELIFALGNK